MATEADLPDSCFAYVPEEAKGADGSKSLRKLRLCDVDTGKLDAGIIGAAAAALGKGYRGNRVDLPDSARAAAVAKVRKAWKTVNPDGKDSDMPEGIQAAEPEGYADVPSTTFLNKFRSKLKELMGDSIPEETWKEAHNYARGHAGGRAKADKKAVDAEAFREHTIAHPDRVLGCDMCMDMGMSPAKLPKADDRVKYRDANNPDQPPRCYDCRFYRWGSCALVEGTIEAQDVCDLFLEQPQTVPDIMRTYSVYSAAADEAGNWRLFTANAPFTMSDPPEWINVLPVPGAYAHPLYGEIVVTSERNKRFVSNFQSKVYQQDMPIWMDIEHQSKLSGAVGYFEALRQNTDGSVDAQVHWTTRGKDLLTEDAFRYFSPEWLEDWRDPVSGRWYQDVLIGGAVCTRPFFKEDALRPLVATEAGLSAFYDVAGDGSERAYMVLPRVAARAERTDDVMVVQLTEEEVQKFRAQESELEALKQANESSKTALDAANTAIKDLRTSERRRKFTDEVMGHGEGSDGAVWVGPIDKNVAILQSLAEAHGEDSEVFKDYVALQREHATILKASGALGKVIGSGEEGKSFVSAAAEVDSLAAKKMEADPKLTKSAAMSAVFAENGALYDRHRAESVYRSKLDQGEE